MSSVLTAFSSGARITGEPYQLPHRPGEVHWDVQSPDGVVCRAGACVLVRMPRGWAEEELETVLDKYHVTGADFALPGILRTAAYVSQEGGDLVFDVARWLIPREQLRRAHPLGRAPFFVFGKKGSHSLGIDRLMSARDVVDVVAPDRSLLPQGVLSTVSAHTNEAPCRLHVAAA